MGGIVCRSGPYLASVRLYLRTFLSESRILNSFLTRSCKAPLPTVRTLAGPPLTRESVELSVPANQPAFFLQKLVQPGECPDICFDRLGVLHHRLNVESVARQVFA